MLENIPKNNKNELDIVKYKDLIAAIEKLRASSKYTNKLQTLIESYNSLMECGDEELLNELIEEIIDDNLESVLDGNCERYNKYSKNIL